MDDLFQELITALSEAQVAVEDEVANRLNPQPGDEDEFARLAKTVGEFSAQADGLLVMMLEREAPADMIDTAGTLADFFDEAKERLSRRMMRQA